MVQFYQGRIEATRAERTSTNLCVSFIWTVYATVGSRTPTGGIRSNKSIV